MRGTRSPFSATWLDRCLAWATRARTRSNSSSTAPARSNSPIVGEPPKLESGYSEAEIVAAERDLGFRLPEDLRALYRTVRGDVAETGLLCRYSPYPLDRLVSTYQEGDPGSLGWDDGPFDAGVVFDTDPPGLVKRLSRGDWWITFAPDYAGNFLMIDLDPTGAGHVGQVMEAGRDFHGPVRYVSTSVTAMLTQVVEALRAGRYEHEAGYLQATTEFDSNNAGARYSEIFSHIDGRDLAREVASLPNPDQKQEVILNDVVDLDLSALAPLRNVRAIRVNRAGSVALRVGGMPSLESLSVSAGRVDLESLAGHPTLWTIDLAGVEGPVDIGALATLPALCRLDVSRVGLVDVTQVTRLAGLRVLTLNKAQWRELRDAGSELPSLAAAEIGGPCSLDESAEWVAWLSDSRPRIHKTVGRV